MRKIHRAVALALSLLAAGSLLTVAAPPAEAATTRSEARMHSYVNYSRRAAGRRAIYLSSGLSDIARRHSARMRSAGRIFHSRNLGYTLRSWRWTRAGENVGRGSNGLWSLHKAFMRSTGHRANILYPSWRRVGIGIVWRGSTAYVTEVFTN